MRRAAPMSLQEVETADGACVMLQQVGTSNMLMHRLPCQTGVSRMYDKEN